MQLHVLHLCLNFSPLGKHFSQLACHPLHQPFRQPAEDTLGDAHRRLRRQ